jgi:hypothetical protein
MNNAQLSAFKAAILAETNASVVAGRAGATRNYEAVANFYRADSSVIVWKSSVSKTELLEAVADSVAALTADQKNTFALLQTGEVVACDRARVRNALFALFPTGAVNTRLVALFKRPANRGEALSATGGAGTDADPHNLRFEGDPSAALVDAALRS